MKRTFTIIVSLILLSMGAACSGEDRKPAAGPVLKGAPTERTSQPSSVFRSMDSREARALIEQRKDLLMVDLRETSELKEGYIAGSVIIPMSQLANGSKSLPADRPLLLICAVGGRSYGVGRYYSAKGYPEIYNLKGGISAWKKAGLPLRYN